MTSLRILVPIKRVIDYAVKPRVNATKTAVTTSGVKMSMNPFDELSIEESVRLRERHKGAVADILAFSAGPAKAADTLRTAMAMGADRALLVELDEKRAGESDLEPLAVAKLLKEVVNGEGCNMVICGKQSIDDDSGQTGQMLAGLLGWGQATQAAKVEVQGDEVLVTKEVDGGEEVVRVKLPAVVTTDLRLNEPRYATLPNIMKAKKKPMEKKTLADFNVEFKKRLETVEVIEPPPRQGGGKVDSVDGLISRLKELGAI
ncbi:electron transfer flavo protein, beta subunit [Choiromyces venosus 120613-1]|uniref:Probable electron transfer flavoprotein subunit beta n=1 Tax=Choiromyces venosus 120613-1 TaxID=1336337 RepID=A0A3N4K480_9PEZI|nr:electron transfer flavo protein, beta subunit [Choiromyces venosus 120613-1]